MASKAFLKLEDDQSISDEDRKEYQKLAFQIFLRYVTEQEEKKRITMHRFVIYFLSSHLLYVVIFLFFLYSLALRVIWQVTFELPFNNETTQSTTIACTSFG
jgi:hypothetical protein